MDQGELKKQAAFAAFELVKHESVIGVGTGSTVNYFIEKLADIKSSIDMTVSSSDQSTKLLKQYGIPVVDLNYAKELPVYVDGADEINEHLQMIKGGGGALTREKIVAASAKQFVCVADESKYVSMLGKFPLAIEVIPMARGLVARELVKLGGDPVYREDFKTDGGNIILDVYNLDFTDPVALEQRLNNIVGVVENGVFAMNKADVLLLASASGVKVIE